MVFQGRAQLRTLARQPFVILAGDPAAEDLGATSVGAHWFWALFVRRREAAGTVLADESVCWLRPKSY